MCGKKNLIQNNLSTMSNNEIIKEDNGLRDAAINVQSHLLLCDNARCTEQFTKSSTIWEKDNNYDWLLRLKCIKCKTKWAICCKCKSCTKALTNNRQISLHKNTYHKDNDHTNVKKRKKNVLDDIDAYLESKKPKGDETININDHVHNDLVDFVDMVDSDNLVDIHDSKSDITVQKLPNEIATNTGKFCYILCV